MNEKEKRISNLGYGMGFIFGILSIGLVLYVFKETCSNYINNIFLGILIICGFDFIYIIYNVIKLKRCVG